MSEGQTAAMIPIGKQLFKEQNPQQGEAPQRPHATHLFVEESHLLPLQHGQSALQLSPAARHSHEPLTQPRPEQHCELELQLVAAVLHAAHSPAAQ